MLFDTRIPKGFAEKPQDLFFLQFDFTNANAKRLDAGTSKTISFTVDGDAHLLLSGGSRVATDGATDLVTQPFVPVTVSMKTSSSGRELMEDAVHIENIFGTAQLPTAWPRPKFLQANSTIQVTCTNLSGALGFNLRLNFFCFKIFLS